jgi:hypothetical protein
VSNWKELLVVVSVQQNKKKREPFYSEREAKIGLVA